MRGGCTVVLMRGGRCRCLQPDQGSTTHATICICQEQVTWGGAEMPVGWIDIGRRFGLFEMGWKNGK